MLSRVMCFSTILLAAPLFGGGFVAEEGSLFFKLDYTSQDADSFFPASGDQQTLFDLLGVNDVEENSANLYLELGLTKRLTLSMSVQYQDAEVGTPGGPLPNDGFTDAWLQARYLLYSGRWNLVLLGGAKIPLEDNEATLPQLSSGEAAYDLGLATGFGATRYYLEADVFYRIQEGRTRSPIPAVDGLAYDDQWGAVFKGGLNLHPRLGLEGLINLGQTAADLEASSPEAFGGGFLDLEEGRSFRQRQSHHGPNQCLLLPGPGKNRIGPGSDPHHRCRQRHRLRQYAQRVVLP